MEEVLKEFKFLVFLSKHQGVCGCSLQYCRSDVVVRWWDTIPVTASLNLLFEVLWSLGARSWVFSNLGNVVSCDSFSNHFLWLCGFTVRWNVPRKEFRNFWWGLLSCYHVMSVCLPVFHPLQNLTIDLSHAKCLLLNRKSSIFYFRVTVSICLK